MVKKVLSDIVEGVFGYLYCVLFTGCLSTLICFDMVRFDCYA